MSRSALILLLFFLVVTPVIAADTYNISTEPRVYFTEEEAIPIELWFILIALGVVFIGAGWLVVDNRSVLSVISMAFFFASAWATPYVGFFSHVTIPVANCTTPTNCSSYTIVPTVSLATQPWMMYLLYGLALVSLLLIFDGVIRMMQDVVPEDDWPNQENDKW